MVYKQLELIKIIRQRIEEKIYCDFLPRAAELAHEFSVNVKTVNKALNQLEQQGVVERKKHIGTRILSTDKKTPRNDIIEVLFEGYEVIFTHPFWSNIWESMVRTLSTAGFRPMLSMYETDSASGLLRLDNLSFYPSVGRIILGTGEKILIDRAIATHTPFITACDPLDPAIPQISFDFTDGIDQAVQWLYQRGCRKIGFIGQIQSYLNPSQLNKFDAYLKALQRFCQVSPALIGNTRPHLGGGAKALETMLQTASPDALLAAYDSQTPEILQVLRKHHLNIPVVGCDGLQVPGVPEDRPMIKVPLRECGELIAQKLIHAINVHRKPGSVRLKAEFIPPRENG